ncbi:MAG: hypothetical protein IKB73_02065 [Ruminococcus sp.]|nr:hypothetical protein [Ruminococcus sp.]
MKKIVSIFLVAMSLIPAYAAQNINPNPGEYIYEDRFVKEYVDSRDFSEYYYYSELYYHHVDENDENSEIDWVLVSANINMFMERLYSTSIGNRLLFLDSEEMPFSCGYAVYDVKQDCFVELSNSMLDDYEDLEDVVNNEVRIGKLRGDTDSDKQLTILDATTLQMGLVENKYEYSYMLEYKIADFDCDYKVTVMDATAIQMKLAGIEA